MTTWNYPLDSSIIGNNGTVLSSKILKHDSCTKISQVVEMIENREGHLKFTIAGNWRKHYWRKNQMCLKLFFFRNIHHTIAFVLPTFTSHVQSLNGTNIFVTYYIACNLNWMKVSASLKLNGIRFLLLKIHMKTAKFSCWEYSTYEKYQFLDEKWKIIFTR